MSKVLQKRVFFFPLLKQHQVLSVLNLSSEIKTIILIVSREKILNNILLKTDV